MALGIAEFGSFSEHFRCTASDFTTIEVNAVLDIVTYLLENHLRKGKLIRRLLRKFCADSTNSVVSPINNV